MTIKLGLPSGTNIVYKIRRKSDGLFSGGGTSWVNFSKKGKIWKQQNHLTSHLNQIDRDTRQKYEECEIVCFEIVETPLQDSMTITEYLNERSILQQEKERKAAERYEAMQKEARRKEFEKLKEEFE